MPRSSPGNEPASQSESDVPGSEDSDSSSSDFEIQAVTTADGVRTQKTAGETENSDENEQLQVESEAVKANHSIPRENLTNALGLSAYSESSSSDENPAPEPAPKPVPNPIPKQTGRPKKRVRFADDPPEKKQRVERTNGPMNGPVNGHLDTTANDEAEEVAVLAELAEFEAAVADAGRDIEDIEADLIDAEDAREEAKQHELEERVKRLREAVTRRRMQVKSGGMNDQKRESSSSSDVDSDKGVYNVGKIETSVGRS